MKKRIIAAGALFCACLTVVGAGFQTLEQGAANLGSALAGATANANGDASAAFWNASAGFNAGLAVGETKVDICANVILSKFDYVDGPTGVQSGDAGCTSLIPNVYIMHRVSEDLIVGLSMSTPYGLETDYENYWLGCHMAMNSTLITFDINPTVAYKVNDVLSLHAGVSAQWLHANLSAAPYYYMPVPNPTAEYLLTGDSWGVGGNAGFTVNYAEDGRFGFQWRSGVCQRIEGNAHLDGSIVSPIDAELNLPHSFTVGWYQRLRGELKKFAVMAEYSYTMWSSFDRLKINGTSVNQDESWSNVSRVAIGAHFFPLETDDLVLRIGSCWDETPIKDSEHRYSRIPCTDRIWFSGGVGYKWRGINIDLAYTYIYFYDNPGIKETSTIPLSPNLDGKFEGRAHVFALQLGYKF